MSELDLDHELIYYHDFFNESYDQHSDDPPPQGHPSYFSREGVEHIQSILLDTLQRPEDYPEHLSCSLTPIDKNSIHLFAQSTIARKLIHLPEIDGRTQVGIFAKKEIAQGAVFLWRSDLGVRWRGVDLDLDFKLASSPSTSESMNRRPLCQVMTSPEVLYTQREETERSSEVLVGLEIAQGASELQRSGPGTLVNFSWCHTESMDAQMSPYHILPPHDLGHANCHFASVVDPRASVNRGEFRLCSAIIVDRPILAGEQLLAFTGAGSSLRAVNIRRGLSKLLSLLTPALVLAPWLRVFASL